MKALLLVALLACSARAESIRVYGAGGFSGGTITGNTTFAGAAVFNSSVTHNGRTIMGPVADQGAFVAALQFSNMSGGNNIVAWQGGSNYSWGQFSEQSSGIQHMGWNYYQSASNGQRNHGNVGAPARMYSGARGLQIEVAANGGLDNLVSFLEAQRIAQAGDVTFYYPVTHQSSVTIQNLSAVTVTSSMTLTQGFQMTNTSSGTVFSVSTNGIVNMSGQARVSARTNDTQTISSANNEQPIYFGVDEFDPQNMHDVTLSSAIVRIPAGASGDYSITFQTKLTADVGGGAMTIYLVKNVNAFAMAPGTYLQSCNNSITATDNTWVSCSKEVSLAAGENLAVIMQTSAAGQVLPNGASFLASTFTVKKL